LTLAEIRARLRIEKKLKVATTSIWRFYDRNEITFKKNLAGPCQRRVFDTTQDRPDVAAARAVLRAEQPKLKAPRLVFIDETSVTTKMVRQYGRGRGDHGKTADRVLVRDRAVAVDALSFALAIHGFAARL
jgi:hypothetical protein